MTPNEYQKLAMRTCAFKSDIYHNLNATKHAVFGLCAEAGEVAGIFQKSYQGHEIDQDHLMKELGDVLWMLAELCESYGFAIEDVMILNIQKLRKRYPDGFDVEHSLNRVEGDI